MNPNESIQSWFSNIGKRITEMEAERKRALTILKEERKQLSEARRQLENALEAQQFIQTVAQQVQQQAHHQISSIVSKCLKTVFDEPYEFNIRFETKRGKTEASISFVRGGLVLEDPPNESGGGVVDVAAFALKIAALILSHPPKRRVLILDEPFKNVSSANQYLDKIPELLQCLSEELNLQIIMITHIDELTVGKVIDMRTTKLEGI